MCTNQVLVVPLNCYCYGYISVDILPPRFCFRCTSDPYIPFFLALHEINIHFLAMIHFLVLLEMHDRHHASTLVQGHTLESLNKFLFPRILG